MGLPDRAAGGCLEKENKLLILKYDMKTLLGTEVPQEARAVLYLCKYDYYKHTIRVFVEKIYLSAHMGLEAYANTPNPESQLVTGKNYNELIAELTKLHQNMADAKWLLELADYL